MGLTVHCIMTAPAGTSEVQAKKFVASVHRVALHFHQEGLVASVHPITSDQKVLRHIGCDWISLPVKGGENSFYSVEVVPNTGFVFAVNIGSGCEPLQLGLCQYPATVRFQGQDLPIKNGAGWRLAGFSKTQYASLHGWEHFLRCHCAVINLLAATRLAGLRVTISDEGEYWPRRSVRKLRENLEHMNGLVAATAGALKDGDDAGENRVESPIFAHKNFERLEAEGAARSAAALKKLKAVMRRL